MSNVRSENSRWGAANNQWRGGVTMHQGYRLLKNPDHPRAGKNGYVREHIVRAEAALGKSLPAGAVVHHANGVRSDNRNGNLVICPTDKYHKLLHLRMRTVAAGGDPNTEKVCCTCKAVKLKTEFCERAKAIDGRDVQCRACHSTAERKRQAAIRGASRLADDMTCDDCANPARWFDGMRILCHGCLARLAQ